MRKVLIVAFGLASLGALAGVQPALAAKRTICQWRLSGAYIGDVESGPLGSGVKICREVNVLVPTDWKGANGLNKNFNRSTNLKNK
jgi:hypothetical protein